MRKEFFVLFVVMNSNTFQSNTTKMYHHISALLHAKFKISIFIACTGAKL